MGNFYGNVTLIGVRPERVVAELELAQQEAYVYAEGGDVVVFPPQGDELELPALAGLLAGRLRAPALAVTVIDSDALVLQAYDAFGELGRELACRLEQRPSVGLAASRADQADHDGAE